MKKTLVAMAVLAASGASFAQATLTGSYAFGYATTSSAAGAKSSGLGTDTAAMQLSASEDLGGGLKASARVSLGGMQRDGAGTGEDAYIQLDGSFGTIKMGTVEAGNGILGNGGAGAPGWMLDNGSVLTGGANIDTIGWTSADMGGLKLKASYSDKGTGATTGLGQGTNGAAVSQPSMNVGVTYAAGALSAAADYTSWTRQGDAAVTSNTNDHRVRISGSYNLGVAKIGAGYSNRKNTAGATDRETVMGVSAPMGAATVGATYDTRQTFAGVKTKGFTLGAQYDLSKRTNIGAGYYSWSTNGVAGDNTGFRVLVGHSF